MMRLYTQVNSTSRLFMLLHSRVCHTCMLNSTAAKLTQLSTGLCVYKMALGQHSIIRRVDTDLVNISPIMELLETKTLDTPDAEVVNEGPVVLQGTWVPLPTARRITKDIADLSGFLSGDLPQSFPESVRSCHQSVLPRASSEQAPTPQIEHDARPTHHLDLPDASVPWEARTWEEDDVAVNFPFQLDYSMFEKAASLVHEVVEESPLSPTEEEMFEVLCSTAEWDRRSATTECTVVEEVTDRPARPSREPPCHDRPLRRSKRVANAIATRARGRPTKRGSRSSLS